MPGLSLREAEKCFLEHNVQLTAQRYNVDRAQAQVVQARLFDNPVISLEQNVYNRLNGKYFDVGKEGEAAIEIEQEIPIANVSSWRKSTVKRPDTVLKKCCALCGANCTGVLWIRITSHVPSGCTTVK